MDSILVTRPYELLIRFAPDGTVQGAHAKSRRVECSPDGVVLLDANKQPTSDQVGLPVPLATAGPDFEAVIGTAITAMAGQKDDALALAAGLRTQLQQAKGALAATTAANDKLQADLDAAKVALETAKAAQ